MSQTRASIFESDGIPAFSKALPLALQHVVAMIVGCVTPAILISDVAGLNERDRVILVQAALFVSAISTLLQLFPVFNGKKFQLGSRLPVIMGISFAYVPSMQAIAESYDVGTILGAQVIGGIVAILVGFTIRKNPCAVSAYCYRNRSFYDWLVPVSYRCKIHGRRRLQSGIRFLEKLAGGFLYSGCCGRIEPFCKRHSETGFHSHRYHRRLCGGCLFRTGGFFRCFFRWFFPASEASALWSSL